MKEAFKLLLKAVKERSILHVLRGLFLVFAYVPLRPLNYPAEAYSRWFNRWDLDTFGL